ncbi:MAG TPA: hypothetical protein VHN99_04050, partial [Deinococcales bacterium]|nr:hypothetical protein [Deinococcales bacterium]
MILAPPGFSGRLLALAGKDARAWLAGLDGRVRGLLAAWNLTPDGPPRHGTWALAMPVAAPEGRAVLRVSFPGAGGPLAGVVAA